MPRRHLLPPGTLLALLLLPSAGFAQDEDASASNAPGSEAAAADEAPAADAPAGDTPVAEAAPPAATDEESESKRPPAEELAAFKDTVSRFSQRMDEFEQDARAYVARREAEERRELDEGYDAVIDELEADDKALRLTAMKRFESFLDKYPATEDSAHVMFRLAELYFEEAEEDYVARDDEFRRLMDEIEESGDLDDIPEEPKKDYRKAVRLYQRILRDHPDYEFLDGTYYMLGYCLSEQSSAQYDEEEGLAMFQALVDRFPESKFAPVGHLRIGEYYFDYNKLDEAIPHYQRVVELEGPQGSLYDEGLYKLAWSRYKQSDYDTALDLLNGLLDWSEQNYLNTGRESAMAPEAVEYTAISFSDVADSRGESPLAVAKTFYMMVGEREFEAKVYKRLADVLTQQARYEDAVAVLQHIQERWPNDPENPTFQWKLGSLYMSMVPQRADLAQQSIADLNQRYNDESTWWAANRANPDAQAVARSYIERSIGVVATQLHTKAGTTKDPADYRKAADVYAQYLAKFPFAKDYYEYQWYYAETLLGAGNMEGAEKEYAQLYKAGDHDFKEGALWWLRAIYFQRIQDQYAGLGSTPEDAVVEKEIELPSGTKRPVYQLGALHEPFLNLSDSLISTDFDAAVARVQEKIDQTEEDLKRARNPEEKTLLTAQKSTLEYVRDSVVKTYGEAITKNRWALAYQSAQILYYHGRYDEARPRFIEIIDNAPEANEAAFAAKLHVDSYTDEEDYENVRKWASYYAGMILGPGGGGNLGDLADIEQQAAIKIIERDRDAGNHLEAAEGYLQFIEDYPKSKPEILKVALYSAANEYQKAGKLLKANELFEQYVNKYPDDPNSRPLMFRLAGNYAQSLELQEGIKYYELLYNTTNGAGSPYGDAPGALYNAGFLRVGIGDFAGAAKNYERYERENPDLPDAEQIYWLAAEQWERVSDAKAENFYKTYLRKYPEKDPDHVMQARFKLVELAEKRGRSREIEQAWEALAGDYARLAPSGKVGPLGRKYAAEAELRKVESDLVAFTTIDDKLKRNPEKYTERMVAMKDELPALESRALALIQTYAEFETTSAALFLVGRAYFEYADALYESPVPKEFAADPDLEMIFLEEIDKLRIPLEDKGKARLLAVLDAAKKDGLWSEWQTKTLAELARRIPAEYAEEKQQFPATGESGSVPRVTAQMLSEDAPSEDKASAGPAGEDGKNEEAPAPAPAPAPQDEGGGQ